MKKPKTKDQLLYFNDDKNQIDVATLELYDWRDAELTLEKNGIQVIEDDIDPNVIKNLVENTDTSKFGFRVTSIPLDQKLAIEYYKEVERTLVEKMNFFAACCRIYHYREDATKTVQSIQLAHLDLDNITVDMFVPDFIDKNFARKSIDISEAYSREAWYLGFWKNLSSVPNSQAFCVSDLSTLSLENYANFGDRNLDSKQPSPSVWGAISSCPHLLNEPQPEKHASVFREKHFSLTESKDWAAEEVLDPEFLTDDAKYFVKNKLGYPKDSNFVDIMIKKGYNGLLTKQAIKHFTTYKHTPNVRWYIFDDLKPNETLLFNHFSFGRKANGLPFANVHGSTGLRSNYEPRRSIDSRVIVFK